QTPGRYGYLPVGQLPRRLPGVGNEYEIAAQLKMQGVPRTPDIANGNYSLGSYVTPPDFHGRYALGLNELGQPVFGSFGGADTAEPPNGIVDTVRYDNVAFDQDTPYEFNLSLTASRGESTTSLDAAYSLGELERLLRAYDADAGSLPSRIWDFGKDTATTPSVDEVNQWRALLTTDSYDLPVPNVVVPQWMVRGPNGASGGGDDFVEVMNRPVTNVSFADLLEYRVRIGLAGKLGGQPKDIPVNSPTELRNAMAVLLPQDLADGLRLDINRPLGNGRDDDNPGDDGFRIVDEPGEVEGAYWEWRAADGSVMNIADAQDPRKNFTGTEGVIRDAVDRNGDGMIDAADQPADLVALHNLRRQDMARDLFVLAMTLVDPFDVTTTKGKAKARQLAQWAINAVDFRDPDNIMTAFEYDENPFDGWSVDGNITTDEGGSRGVVWGSEQPELLITETLAWHDIATEDTNAEVPNTGEQAAKTSDDPADSDPDQFERPRGGTLIEIYNPRPSNPAANADTHVFDGGVDVGVNLSKVAVDPDDPTRKSPVWRMMIYRTGGLNSDPDDPVVTNRPSDPDRSVYFTTNTEFPGADLENLDQNDGVAFYASLPVPSVRPGRYLVVGSGDDNDGD
ncbi:MAG: hypothetical protein MI725_13865, partial [Pirellulales bacterium]|nr:hypothetical protein [Pirellulales bacterium]